MYENRHAMYLSSGDVTTLERQNSREDGRFSEAPLL